MVAGHARDNPNHISTDACHVFLVDLAAKGIDPEPLVADLPYPLETLRTPNQTISEADYLYIAKQYAKLTSQAAPAPLSKQNAVETAIRLEAFPFWVAVIDKKGIVQFVNQSERSIDSVIGQSVLEFATPQARPKIQAAYETAMKTQSLQIIDSYYQMQPNGHRWLENMIYPIKELDEVVGAIFLVRDVTDRYQAQNELERRIQQLRAVADFSAQLKSLFDVSALIQSACDLTQKAFGLYHVHIFLLDAQQQTLTVEAGAGKIGNQIAVSRHSFKIDDANPGIVVTVARSHRVYISNDVQQDPYFIPHPLLPNTAAEMALPIMLGSRLIGVLDVQSEQANFFSPEDQRVLQTLADQVALAIQNAQLYENIMQQWETANTLRDVGLILSDSRDLQEGMMRVLREIKRVLPFHAGGIWLRDPITELQLNAHMGYNETGLTEADIAFKFQTDTTPLLWRLTESQRPIIIADVLQDDEWLVMDGFEWIKSWAAAPIVVREQVIGHLTLDHTDANFYQPHHEPILEVITRQLSLAMENASLLKAEQQQREIAETLRDIGSVLASSLRQEDILQLVLAQVARVLPYDAAAIWLDKGAGTFELAAQFGYDRFNAQHRIQELVFDPEMSIVDGDISIIPDTAQDPKWRTFAGFEWVRSWAAAPIMVRDKLIGEISLDHALPNFYNEAQHAGILEVLTTQISLAVGNAQLYQAERRRRLEIEALQRGNISLSASLELNEVLDAILGATFDLVPAHDAYIYLYENDTLTFAQGRNADNTPVSKPLIEPRQHGLTYTVARSGNTIVVEDIHSHPLYNHTPHESRRLQAAQSIMGIALTFGERVVGVMNLTFLQASDLQRVDINALQLLANQATIAIENARLFKATQEYAVELENRVATRTAELNQERAQLHVILNGMGEGVIYDQNRLVRYSNQKLSEMTGYYPQENEHLSSVLANLAAEDLGNLPDQIFETIREQGFWQGEIRMQHVSGTEFDAGVLSTGIRDVAGKIIGAVTIIRDISQEKALQAQKDRFISNASHELRTPITNIQTRLYLMKKRPEKIQEHLQVVETVTRQMAGLIKDLLDLSRFERGVMRINLQQVVLQDLLNDILTIQRIEAEKKSLHLMTDFPAVPILVMLDPERIQQVITNLLTNAINYTESGGIITMRLQLAAQQVEIVVQDTGVGIPEEMLPQIFQPFFRAQDGITVGTGLGLSISREIVLAHQGTIDAKSQLGKGSTFTVRLPLKPTAVAST